MTGRAVLLFDAESELCRTSVRWVVRHDRRKRLVPVPINSPDGHGLLARVSPSRRENSFHLVLDDGVYSGADVLDPLAELLDRPFAVRFLKRAIGGMGRVQARPESGEVGADTPAVPDVAADSNGAPMPGGPGRPETSSAPEAYVPPETYVPAEAPSRTEPTPPPEAPRAPEAPLRTESAPPPEAAPVADASPAVGVIDRPVPVHARTPESDASAVEPSADVVEPPAGVVEPPDHVTEPSASPEEDEPAGALDWQSRIEHSPFGRGVLSVLILITLIAIVAINLPNSDLRTIAMRPGQPYLNALGLDQAWGVFAPDPRRAVIDVSAFVTYDDGKESQWSIPRNGALVGSYTDYRWGKWEEFLIQPGVGSSLWRPAAEWAASREVRPGHSIKRVVLVERTRQLAPPGVNPSVGPTHQQVFYSLSLRGAARPGKSQAPLPPGGGGL